MKTLEKVINRFKNDLPNYITVVLSIAIISFILNLSLNIFLKYKDRNISLENQMSNLPFEIVSYIDFNEEEAPNENSNPFDSDDFKKIQKNHNEKVMLGIANSVLYFGSYGNAEIYFINDDFINIFSPKLAETEFNYDNMVYIGSNVRELIENEEMFVTDYKGMDKNYPFTNIDDSKITLLSEGREVKLDYAVMEDNHIDNFIKGFVDSEFYGEMQILDESKVEIQKVKEDYLEEKNENLENIVIMPIEFYKATIFADGKNKKAHVKFKDSFVKDTDLKTVIEITKDFRASNDYYKYKYKDIGLKYMEQNDKNNVLFFFLSLNITLIVLLMFMIIGGMWVNINNRKNEYANKFFENSKNEVVRETMLETIMFCAMGVIIGLAASLVYIRRYDLSILYPDRAQNFSQLNFRTTIFTFVIILIMGLISSLLIRNQIMKKYPIEYLNSKRYDN